MEIQTTTQEVYDAIRSAEAEAEVRAELNAEFLRAVKSLADAYERQMKAAKRVKCPDCGKSFNARGIKHHRSAIHRAEAV